MSNFADFIGETGGMDTVKPGSRQPLLELGVHDLVVNRCVAGKTRTGWFYFVAEFEVLSSDNPKHPTGSTAGYFISFKDYPDMAKRQLLDFLMKGLGLTEVEAKDAIKAESVWGTSQIAAGEKMKAVVRQATSKNGKPFKDYAWSPIG